MVLIKTPGESIGRSRRKPHRIKGSVGLGRYLVEHPPDCECQMLHSVKHAPWIIYNQMSGDLSCRNCGTTINMPCPSVRDKVNTKTVYMDLKALEDDLWNFQLKHEGCELVKLDNATDRGPATGETS